jgi:uncharacterized membrane protein YraQ (UPF0718 family)
VIYLLANKGLSKRRKTYGIISAIFFPGIAAIIYGILFFAAPEKAFMAIRNSANIFLNMLIPLCLVFILMVMINLFLKPSLVIRILGKGAGIKGCLLAAAAGIISAGPIYAWYPLLADLKKKGAGYSLIAIFLYNRAFKPFLLPVMIGYFGWKYAVILGILMFFGSFALGGAINAVKSDIR